MTYKILSAPSSALSKSEFISLLRRSVLDSPSDSVLRIYKEAAVSCDSCTNPALKMNRNVMTSSYQPQTVWVLLERHWTHHASPISTHTMTRGRISLNSHVVLRALAVRALPFSQRSFYDFQETETCDNSQLSTKDDHKHLYYFITNRLWGTINCASAKITQKYYQIITYTSYYE